MYLIYTLNYKAFVFWALIVAIGTNSLIVLQDVNLKQFGDFASSQGLKDCRVGESCFINLHDKFSSKETMQFFANNLRIESTNLFQSSIARDNPKTQRIRFYAEVYLGTHSTFNVKIIEEYI